MLFKEKFIWLFSQARLVLENIGTVAVVSIVSFQRLLDIEILKQGVSKCLLGSCKFFSIASEFYFFELTLVFSILHLLSVFEKIETGFRFRRDD